MKKTVFTLSLALLSVLPAYADNYSLMKTDPVPTTITYSLPADTGADGQVLKMNGGSVSWQAGGAAPSGTVIMLDSIYPASGNSNLFDEAGETATLYTLQVVANSYSQVRARACGWCEDGNNLSSRINVYLAGITANTSPHLKLRKDATGAGDIHTDAYTLEFSGAQTAASTLAVMGLQVGGTGTCYVTSVVLEGTLQ